MTTEATEITKESPEDWCQSLFKGLSLPKHIVFDPSVDDSFQYQIIRGHSHDGALIYTRRLVRDALVLLISSNSYYKKTEPDWSKVQETRYRIGHVRIESIYGRVDLPCGNYPGVKETIWIPVCCEYVLKDPEISQ